MIRCYKLPKNSNLTVHAVTVVNLDKALAFLI